MGLPVQIISVVFLVAVSSLPLEESNIEVNPTSQQDHTNGFGYEIIQSKLDMLEFRFTELFVQLKEQGETFLNNQRRVADEQSRLNQIVDRHERKMGNQIAALENSIEINLTHIDDQSRKILELQTICSNHDAIRSQLAQMHPKRKDSTVEKRALVPPNEPEACTENGRQMSGLCRMQIGPEDAVVWREKFRFGNGWVVVLQRYDGSEPFDRSWVEYRDGFGTMGKEFWIGLERLHLLTAGSAHELVVEMEDFEGKYAYAEYGKFSVGPEKEQYPLLVADDYVGTAGDSLKNHVGKKFEIGSECSGKYGNGGGWYFGMNDCFNANLMGLWQNNKAWDSITWETFEPKPNPLKYIRMMVRKL